MFEEIELISYRVHEANLKKKGGNLSPPKNSFREWDSVSGEVKEEDGVGGNWFDRIHSTINYGYYLIKITIIYNSYLSDTFVLSCKSLKDTYEVIDFIKENYEKFFNSVYIETFRWSHMGIPIKEVLYEVLPSENLSPSDDYHITASILNYIVLGGPRPSSKPHLHSVNKFKEESRMENTVYLHHLIARYKSNEKFLSEYDEKEGSFQPVSKEQLLKQRELYKQQIADYIMQDGVYEAVKACNI